MVFRWGRRRFYLWHFSCADRILKDHMPAAEWAASYLNDFRRIKGIAFTPNEDGGIDWRRAYRLPICSRDECSRWCFRYQPGYRYNRDTNQIVVWVFNYCRDDDLKMLPAAFKV